MAHHQKWLLAPIVWYQLGDIVRETQFSNCYVMATSLLPCKPGAKIIHHTLLTQQFIFNRFMKGCQNQLPSIKHNLLGAINFGLCMLKYTTCTSIHKVLVIVFIPHRTTKLLGGYIAFTPSVRPSVPHPLSPLKCLQFWMDPFHILSSNFRRCVTCKVSCKIWIFGNF